MFLVSVGGTIHNANLSVDVVKPVSFLEELSMVLDYFNIPNYKHGETING